MGSTANFMNRNNSAFFSVATSLFSSGCVFFKVKTQFSHCMV